MQLSITLLIILFTGLISYQAFSRYDIIDRLKHFPYKEFRTKEFHRLLSSGFVHGDWIHLLVNMFVLYSFGSYIEEFFVVSFGKTTGRILFVLVYLVNIVIANIPTMFIHKDNPGFSSIGASGAVSGIVFMFILLNPWSMLLLFFIIPVPAILAGVGYLWYSSWESRKGRGRLDHVAHFAGALAGMAILILLKPEVIQIFLDRLINEFPL